MTSVAWNILGLLANLVGVILLFLFGMPFRVRTRGYRLLTSQPVESEKRRLAGLELTYDAAGWLGLALIVLGTAMQILATVTHG